MATTVPGAFFLFCQVGHILSKGGRALPQQAKRPASSSEVLETEVKPYLNISVQIDAMDSRHLAKSLP